MKGVAISVLSVQALDFDLLQPILDLGFATLNITPVAVIVLNVD